MIAYFTNKGKLHDKEEAEGWDEDSDEENGDDDGEEASAEGVEGA